MLVHSSIAELRAAGLYDQYCALIGADSLASINELIGPGWMPVELVLAHYGACEKTGQSESQVYAAGLRAGEKMGDALLIAGGRSGVGPVERTAWDMIGAFSRMGRRLYDGGSSQYVKVGPNTLVIEYKENPLFSFAYYRIAHGGFMRQTFGSVGVPITSFTMSAYRPQGAQIESRMTWK
jgi:hypothetical protein